MNARRESTMKTCSSLTLAIAILGAFVVLYAFEIGTPTRQLLLIGVVAGCCFAAG